MYLFSNLRGISSYKQGIFKFRLPFLFLFLFTNQFSFLTSFIIITDDDDDDIIVVVKQEKRILTKDIFQYKQTHTHIYTEFCFNFKLLTNIMASFIYLSY